MAEKQEDLLKVLFARQALSMQLMRLLLRERAAQNGQTEADIMAWGEEIKRFFEGGVSHGVALDFLTGAVDAFFESLAKDVQADREGT